MASDRELVKNTLNGDRVAFGKLVDRYRETIIGFCYRRIGDFQEAEDLAQEVFLRAYFGLHDLREPEKFGGWLRAVALRLCQSWHRKRHEMPLPLEEIPSCYESLTCGDGFALSGKPLLMREAMQALPEAQRLTLKLKYIEGYTMTEVADSLRVPVETVRTRLRRAKQHLKEVWTAMMEEGRTDAGFTRRVLEKVDLVSTESGLIWPVYACLHALKKDWSLAYVMGITGTAFRFTVDEKIDESGPTHVLDWDTWFARIREWGFEVVVHNAQLKSFSPNVATDTEEEFHATQKAAWEGVRASLDRGIPAIAWMPMTVEQKAQGIRCEYGLLVGYDTEAGVYHVRLPWREMYSVPWDGFGRADPVNWFNVIVFGKEKPLDERALERDALRYGVEHARSDRPGHGLEGYRMWLKSLETGRIQPNGSPKIARLLKEGREYAAVFLKEIADHFPDAAADLSEAESRYRQVAQAWEEYLKVFMPSTPGYAREPDKRAAGQQAVHKACVTEQAAVGALERALARC